MSEPIKFVQCQECGHEQADMGDGVACEECGAAIDAARAARAEGGEGK